MKLVTYPVCPKGHTDNAMAHEQVNSSRVPQLTCIWMSGASGLQDGRYCKALLCKRYLVK